MEKLFAIYKITSPLSEKFYIGVTCREISRRLEQHVRDSRKSKHRMANWLRKYSENIIMETLISGLTKEQALDIESRAVDFGFRFCASKILNTAPGGGMPPGNKGKRLSEQHKARIRASNMGREASEETKAKLSAARRTRVCKQETKDKMSAAMKGRKLTQEHRNKMSLARKGVRLSEAHKAALRAAKATPDGRAVQSAAARAAWTDDRRKLIKINNKISDERRESIEEAIRQVCSERLRKYIAS